MFDMMTFLDAAYLGELIGLIAGSTILYSGWPALKVQLKSARAGSAQERAGCLLLGLGNLFWVPSALLTGSWALVGMAATNAIIRLEIWRRMRLQHRKERQ